MTYDADGRLGKLVEDGETRHIITEDFEWLQTRQLSRIQIRLAGNVIASDEATYNPTEGPSCAVLAPALDAGWGAPLGLLFPGLCAFLVLQVGFALRRRPQGDRLRPVLAAGTAGVFLAATSVPFPGVVAEAHAADPTGVTYYHSDHLGSSVVITNGMTVKRVVYRPFGQAASGSDPVPEFGFTGQRFVDSLEIYDYGARWYDPALGRFLQPDPIVRGPSHVPNTSDPQTINPYSYVLNNPLNLVDPTGNTPLGYSSLNYSSSTYSYPSYGSSSFSYSYPSYYTEEQARFYGYLNAGSSSYFSSAPSLSTFASSLSSQSGVSAASPASGGGFWSGVGGVLGNTWNLPNTIVGTAWGLAGMAVGGTASVAWGALHVASFGRLGGFSWFGGGNSLGNNAIQFTNSPLHFSGVATTVGNAIIYGGGAGNTRQLRRSRGSAYDSRPMARTAVLTSAHPYESWRSDCGAVQLVHHWERNRRRFEQPAGGWSVLKPAAAVAVGGRSGETRPVTTLRRRSHRLDLCVLSGRSHRSLGQHVRPACPSERSGERNAFARWSRDPTRVSLWRERRNVDPLREVRTFVPATGSAASAKRFHALSHVAPTRESLD